MWLDRSLVHFSTFEAWQQFLEQTFVPLEIQLPSSLPEQHYLAAHQQLGSLCITELSLCNQITVKRTPALANQSDQELYKITVQLAGTSEIQQKQQRTLLTPGQWAVYDTTQPYLIHTNAQSHFLVLQVQADLFSSWRPYIQPALAQGFSLQTGCGQMLHTLIKQSVQQYSSLSSATSEGVARAIVSLIGSQLAEYQKTQVPPNESLVRTVQFLHIQQYIERNLHRSDLSVTELSRVFKCSRRYLYNLFATQQLSPADYIQRQRLESSCKFLANPNYKRPLFELAYQHGFKDATAFSHAFKRRYGVSPSVWRQQALQSL